jgi:hypothetical protein
MIERMGNIIIPVEYIKGIPLPGFLAHVNMVKKIDEIIDVVNSFTNQSPIDKTPVEQTKEELKKFRESIEKVQDESAVEMAGKIMKNAFSPVNYHDLMAAKEEIEKPRCKHHVLSEKDGSTQYECINCGEYFEIM